MTLDLFCSWVARTPMSVGIGSVPWITPLVQSVHIFAISTIMGSILMMDLRVLGAIGRREPVEGFARRYLPWAWSSLLVLLLSGSVLVIGEPKRSLENPVFAQKMTLLLAAVVITAAFHSPLGREGAFDRSPFRRRSARVTALASLAIWSSIVFCGRWIAYAQG